MSHATLVAAPTVVFKRDGREEPFDLGRIERAIALCYADIQKVPPVHPRILATRAVEKLHDQSAVMVEGIQDAVVKVLTEIGDTKAKNHYVEYRAERERERNDRPIPADVKAAFDLSAQYFPTPIQQFQFFDKYSRFDHELGRRETWEETVNRAVDFLHELTVPHGNPIDAETWERLRRGILKMEVMPSMRLLAMAGPAARRNHISVYNCSFQGIDDIHCFPEALLISMSGTGVGFSVESQFVEKLPRIQRQKRAAKDHLVIEDSTEGWYYALLAGLEHWFSGHDITFDYSQIRPAGAILKTKGGRASGPLPLQNMMESVRKIILARQGNVLRPIDAHDIMCHVGNAAVQGGVRRSAMISLFDWDDNLMLHAKDGDLVASGNTQRWNANNSVVWPEHGITQNDLMRQMLAMDTSQNGEPGIFNRAGAWNNSPERRKALGYHTLGTNPCVTGDTWIAVADGRGRARMRDIVAEGRDIPVWTVADGKLAVRTMRNPRKTGTSVPVYRVNFSDGSYTRVTANHKFVLTDGTEKQAVELAPNDALVSTTVQSYAKRGLPGTRYVNYDSDGSYRMMVFGGKSRSEHRRIYEAHTGKHISGHEFHIHHRDHDSMNNAFENLQLLSAKEHAQMHRERMLGANNPVHKMTDAWHANLSAAETGLLNGNAFDISNAALEEVITDWIAGLGHKPSIKEYWSFAKANQLPQSFSAYRRAHFGGGVSHTLASIAAKLDVTPLRIHRIRKITDLPVVREKERTYVLRNCEDCGAEIKLPLSRREIAYCHPCTMKRVNDRRKGNGWAEHIKAAKAKSLPMKRERQMSVYNDLVVELGRHPMKTEWVARCKERGISAEMCRDSSPFRSYDALKEAAAVANHRVVSVVEDGVEDVYTGTVDETHTYFAIGTERTTASGTVEMSYVLNRQCGEINLRNLEFCNLSQAIARPWDTPETLAEKVELATIIGTVQSLAADFPLLRPEWKKNCEDERLLGVDINGQADSPVTRDARVLDDLREYAVATNAEYAKMLGVNQSAAVSCVKPNGNSSQLLNCSSGLHARHAQYYRRNIRVSNDSPMHKVLRNAGVPMSPENGQSFDSATTWVIHFPVKAPSGAITRNQVSAIEQCETWLRNKTHWTDHNPSVTISYGPDELIPLTQWLWDHRDMVGGMSFLPRFDARYDNMPYEEITATEYEKLASEFPEIDYSKIFRYEEFDTTTSSSELACFAGNCEVEVVPTGEGK